MQVASFLFVLSLPLQEHNSTILNPNNTTYLSPWHTSDTFMLKAVINYHVLHYIGPRFRMCEIQQLDQYMRSEAVLKLIDDSGLLVLRFIQQKHKYFFSLACYMIYSIITKSILSSSIHIYNIFALYQCRVMQPVKS